MANWPEGRAIGMTINGVKTLAIFLGAVILMPEAAAFLSFAAEAEDDYPGEQGREVIESFVERERRREEEEALRRSLDAWAVSCRRYYRGSYLSRDLKKLLRWLENPKNRDCLPPPPRNNYRSIIIWAAGRRAGKMACCFGNFQPEAFARG